MKDFIDLELAEIKFFDEDENSSELANSAHSMLNPLRNLARVQLKLCHSLPVVNSNGASWTYATLKNSCETVAGQILNLNHEMKDNAKLLNKKIENNLIIGYMVSGKIADLEQDEDGLYPLIPESGIPIVVEAFIFKRSVPALIEKLKQEKMPKVSMECEFSDIGFIYDNVKYSKEDLPDHLVGLREYEGKKIIRVLGGLDPNGGYVNFWGCAILDKQNPADKGAGVFSAVATEIGDSESLILDSEEEETIESLKSQLIKNESLVEEIQTELSQVISGKLDQARSPFMVFVNNNDENEISLEISDIIDGEAMYKTVKGNSPEDIVKFVSLERNLSEKELAKIKTHIEGYIQMKTNKKEVSQDSENKVDKTKENKTEVAYLDGSWEDKIAKLKKQACEVLKEEMLEHVSFYIMSLFEDSIVVECWPEWDEGREVKVPDEMLGIFKIPYTMNGNSMVLGEKERVEIKQVMSSLKAEETASETEEKGENLEMKTDEEKKAEALAAEEAKKLEDAKAEETEKAAEEAAAKEKSEKGESETAATLAEKMASIIAENEKLKERLNAHEEAARQEKVKETVASRKARLSEEFDDVDELFSSEEMNELLSNGSDEKFESQFKFLTSVAKKAKKAALPMDGEWKKTAKEKANDEEESKEESKEETNSEAANEQKTPAKQPFAPPVSNVSQDAKNRFNGF